MAKKPDNERHPSVDYQIYTNGALCDPLRFRDKDGRITWHWVVSEFIGDSYRMGEAVSPKEFADTSEELLEFPEDE